MIVCYIIYILFFKICCLEVLLKCVDFIMLVIFYYIGVFILLLGKKEFCISKCMLIRIIYKLKYICGVLF